MIDLQLMLQTLNIDYKIGGNLKDNDMMISYIEDMCSNEIPMYKRGSYVLVISKEEVQRAIAKNPEIVLHAKIILVLVKKELDFKVEQLCEMSLGVVIAIDNTTIEENVLSNIIKDKLDENNYQQEELLKKHYIELVGLVSRGASISEIELFSNTLLGNPMMITDETYYVIAYTKNRPVSDPVWEEIIRNHYSPTKLVNQTNVNGFWKRLENSNMPLFVDDTAFGGCTKRVVARIKISAKTIGYITLLEVEKKITSIDLLVIQMLAEVLAVKINENNVISMASGQMKDDFTMDLLKGNMKSETMIQSRAKSMNLSFEKWNTVLCVMAEKNQYYIGSQLENIRLFLQQFGDMCIYTFDGTYAFFVFSFKKLEVWDKLLGAKVEEYMSKKQYMCTLSLPTKDVVMIGQCYEQVKQMNHTLVLSKKKINRKVYSYNYMVTYNMVSQLYQSNEKELYSSKALEQLLYEDKEKGSEYVNTLRCYFKNNQNVSDTASGLFIHRNTVNYRLNKIREIIEDDFDNYLIRLHLQIAIMAYDIYE